MKTENIIKELKKLEDVFDFSNLDKNHELFSNRNKKVVGFIRKETPKIIWIDEFVCLRSKMFSFKCGNYSKKKLKSISNSQSKHIKFEKQKICSDGKEYQKECDNYILRSINHETYPQKVNEHTLSFLMINDVK